MADTHDIGRAFWYFSRTNRDAKRLTFAETIEIEEPYRRANSVVIRLPFERGLVLGWWRPSGWDEQTALYKAVSGWGVDPWDDSLEDPEVKRTIRDNVAAQVGGDINAEWQILSALGVEA